jgi:hypothetical protein
MWWPGRLFWQREAPAALVEDEKEPALAGR